jgi:uncharacterized protein YdeI (BOF family)
MSRSIAILVLILFAYPTVAAAHDAKPQTWMGTVRGEVTRIDGEIFVIQDSLGRNIRLHITDTAMRDDGIKIGDEIVARILHKGKENYVKSFKKILTTSVSESVRSPFVEGEVLKIDGDAYIVKDITGREVQLKVDGKTWRDGNITLGDTIHANIDNVESAHAERVRKQ